MQLTKSEVKKLIAACVVKNPSITRADIIWEIKLLVQHADLPAKSEIDFIMHEVKRALTPSIAGYGLMNVQKIKNLWHEQLGWEIGVSMVDNLPWMFMYMWTDKQRELAQKCSHIFLILDWCLTPKLYKRAITICGYHDKKCMPLGYVLLQSKWASGFEIALKYMI